MDIEADGIADEDDGEDDCEIIDGDDDDATKWTVVTKHEWPAEGRAGSVSAALVTAPDKMEALQLAAMDEDSGIKFVCVNEYHQPTHAAENLQKLVEDPAFRKNVFVQMFKVLDDFKP